jgi:hypothetical protein
MGFFEIRSLELFAWGWLPTLIILISASSVARIIGVSHWYPASMFYSSIHPPTHPSSHPSILPSIHPFHRPETELAMSKTQRYPVRCSAYRGRAVWEKMNMGTHDIPGRGNSLAEQSDTETQEPTPMETSSCL